MSYGEKVVDLKEAGEAGFVAVMSSGRTAQLLLRDAQGRTAIQTRFLEPNTITGVGLLSGFKTVFSGGGHLKNVTAVHAQSVRSNGRSKMVIANAQAHFHLWLLDWAGQTSFIGPVNAHDQLEAAIRESQHSDFDHRHTFLLLDFAFLNQGKAHERRSPHEDSDDNLTILSFVLVLGPSSAQYLIADLNISKGSVSIGRALPIQSYTPSLDTDQSSKARLILSESKQTAFVVLKSAIVLVSVAGVVGEPRAKSKKATKQQTHFESTIYLRDREHLGIMGAGLERKDSDRCQSTVKLYIRDYGLIRAIVNEPDDPQKAVSRSPLNPKNMLEQAVFNGALEDNPLDLVRGSKTTFTLSSIEAAAVAISEEITTSSSSFIQPLLSMNQHLEQRAAALKGLALHLKNNYSPFRAATEWYLLSMAEKVAAAKKIWSMFELRAEQDPQDPRFLPELIEYLPESVKTEIDPDSGESDQLRQWFLRDVISLENLIPWAFQGVVELAKLEEYTDEQKLAPLVSDANDIVIGALETAWKFRSDNAWLYNLPTAGKVKDGLFEMGYKGLDEPWTAQYGVANKSRSLAINGSSIVANIGEIPEESAEPNQLVMKIAEDNPKLIRLCCRSYEELCQWLESNNSEENEATLKEIRDELQAGRKDMLNKLPDLGMARQGLALAEEYADMGSLVGLFGDEIVYWSKTLAEEKKKARQETEGNGVGSDEFDAANKNVTVARNHIQELDELLKRYFEKFGYAWAEALYSAYAKNKVYVKILDASAYPWQAEQVSKYLKATRRRQRLGWINDAVAKRDFAAACANLTDVAGEESSLWSKKVELSLAKLAFTAATENNESSEKLSEADRVQADAQLLMEIQHKLADHTFPSMYNALDGVSELSLLMQDFGRHKTGGRPSLQQLLERGLDSLRASHVMDAEQLIDVLTLMDHHPCDMTNRDISGDEFFLALQVLQHSGFSASSDRYQMLLKIIWRRCFIEDQWDDINNTSHKPDEVVARSLERTKLFRTLYKGTKASLFEGSSAIPLLNTEDVRGAGHSPDDFKDRFPSEDLRVPIAQDTAREDDVLQTLVKEQRLDSWVARAKDWVGKCLHAETEAKANEERKVHEAANRERAKEKGQLAEN